MVVREVEPPAAAGLRRDGRGAPLRPRGGQALRTQPALSKRIRALEHEWGVTLFLRNSRSVVLTAEGADPLTAAQETLAAAARLTERVDRLDPDLPERLHVGFVGQAANELTPLLVRRFARERPDVVVDLRQYPFRDLSAGLRDGAVDLGIVRLPIGLDGLRLRRLFVEPRVAVLPAHHPLAGGSRLSVHDLFEEPWIQPASDDAVYRAFALALDRRAAAPLLGPVAHTIDELLEAVLRGAVSASRRPAGRGTTPGRASPTSMCPTPTRRSWRSPGPTARAARRRRRPRSSRRGWKLAGQQPVG